VAATKAAGLREHYGLDTPDATAYFDVHAVRDVEHAAEGRELLARHVAAADVILPEAGRVLLANWTLLDGVERVLSPA
jgi:pyrroloquinoline quinone (PQQ) biosynthesis protein C